MCFCNTFIPLCVFVTLSADTSRTTCLPPPSTPPPPAPPPPVASPPPGAAAASLHQHHVKLQQRHVTLLRPRAAVGGRVLLLPPSITWRRLERTCLLLPPVLLCGICHYCRFVTFALPQCFCATPAFPHCFFVTSCAGTTTLKSSNRRLCPCRPAPPTTATPPRWNQRSMQTRAQAHTSTHKHARTSTLTCFTMVESAQYTARLLTRTAPKNCSTLLSLPRRNMQHFFKIATHPL